MKQKLRLFMSMLLLAVCGVTWGQTLTRLESIDQIDEDASYVLGLDGTGFHYEGTSSWGKIASLNNQTLLYTLTKASDENSFTAKTDIGGTTYYLQIPDNSNTFSMATSAGTNTDIIIGTTTQVTEDNYAVANKNTPARHLRIGASGIRSYASTNGSMAYFYKYTATSTPSISFEKESVTIPTSSTYTQIAQISNADNAVVTYSSNNTDVATVDASTGEVSAGTTEGRATITASMTVDNKTYYDTYEITVISIEDGVFDFSLGYDYGSGLEESESAIRNESTWTARNVTLKPTGNYAFWTNNTLRIYSGGSFSVSVPEGYEITNIIFNGERNLNKMVPNSGELTGNGTECTWTGKSQTITFTRGTDNPYYTKISVTYQEKSNEEIATTTTIETSGITNTDVYTSTEAGSLSATVTAGDGPISDATVTWTSSNENVATINQEGTVTLVGAGTTTITATYAGVENVYKSSSATYELTVTNNDPDAPGTVYVKVTSTSDITDGQYLIVYEDGGVAFDGSLTNLDQASKTISVTIEEGTITSEELVGSEFTIDITDGTLKSASGFYIGVSSNSNGLRQTEDAETYKNSFAIDADGYAVITAVFEGSTMSLRYNKASDQQRFRYYRNNGQQAICLYKKSSSTSSAVATTITIDDRGIDTNDLMFDTTAGSLSAIVKAGENVIEGATVTWSSSDESVATIGDNGRVYMHKVGTTTITASYAGIEGQYKPSSATYDFTVEDSNAPGKEHNPYSVGDARDAINAGTGVTDVYVKGIVSEIVTPYNSQYGNISYNISEDGSTTSDQLQAYRGKSYNGDNFTSEDDIQVGDEVVIYGNLTKYDEIYEFAQANQLVSLVRKAQPTITINPSELNLEDVTTAEITVSPTGFAVSTYTSSNEAVATVADGVVTAVGAGTATITVSWETQTIEGTEYEAGSKEISVTVVDPNAPGTENNPYTVAQARAAIDAGTGVTGVYVKGIVSGIVEEYNATYGNISYNISDDGNDTSAQLEAFRGKSYNGENFTSADDIQVGDEVVIYGNLTLYQSTIYELEQNNELISLVRSEKVNATVEINKTELNLAVENEKTATITVTPAGLNNLSYSSSDENVATVSEGTVTAIAVGEATITVSWYETEIEDVVYKSGEKTFVITVIDNAPVQCVFEEDYYTRFDFTKNGWGLPENSGNGKTTGSYTNSEKTIALEASTKFYYNTDGYLLLGKNGSTLTLPAFDFDVMAIEVTGKNGASGIVKQNIFVDDEDEDKAVSTETTGATGTNLYFIDEGYQSAGNIYTIKVTSAHNTQFTEIKVYKKSAFVELSVSDAGYRTYCDADALNFNVASDGLKAYIVEGVEAEGSTNLVLKEVGKVPAETGVLLEAEEGTYYVAKEAVKAEEEEATEESYDNVSTNQLVGVTEAKEVDPTIIVLMNGENGVGFYKTSKTFTVGAHTAYLTLRTLETVASTEGDGVKLMNLYGFDDDTPTGITVINAEQLSGKEAVIYSLSGQRVSRVVKGLYIVNGKKVMVK